MLIKGSPDRGCNMCSVVVFGHTLLRSLAEQSLNSMCHKMENCDNESLTIDTVTLETSCLPVVSKT